ncbi:MAG: SPFH domain-containing protein [archaeon]|nr:SPFH domain-containing protein [archaeon]
MEELSDLVKFALVGGAASVGVGISYILGKWPFTRIDNREFQMTQWVTREPGPALEGPGTRLMLSPLYHKVKGIDGKVENVRAEYDTRNLSLHFRSKDNYEGMLNFQYVYVIPNGKSAKTFYWNTGADILEVDQIVKGMVSEKIGGSEGEKLPENSSAYMTEVVDKLNDDADSNSLYNSFGVKVIGIQIGDWNFDAKSQDILSMIPKAERQRESDRIKSETTMTNMERYIGTAQKIKDAGSSQSVGDIAMQLYLIDNAQTMSEQDKANIFLNLGWNTPFILGHQGQTPTQS